MELVRVHDQNLMLLEDFLAKAGDSLSSFRYFSKRPLSVVRQHLVTYLLCEKGEPLCYGHLDQENGKTWLGVAAIYSQRGKGLGRVMMRHLLAFAGEKSLHEIHLSVDKGNDGAIALYTRFGFRLSSVQDNVLFYKLALEGE